MNFDIKCSIEEAVNIAEHITVNIPMAAAACYSGVFNKTKPENDKRWKHYRALSTVYMLGYISGCRAVREKQKNNRRFGRPKKEAPALNNIIGMQRCATVKHFSLSQQYL